MKIVFIGDIVGRSGRDAVLKYIPQIKEKFKPDVIIANAENAAAGYGLTEKISEELFNLGINVLTLGNHSWDQKEMLSYIEKNKNIIRPLNYPSNVPGKGEITLELNNGKKILVIQIMLRLFINIPLDDPFKIIKERLQKETLNKTVDAILVDMHGEATSEKTSFGHFIDGQVSAVIGTHTHIPTADAKILVNKTAYQTDVGMTGNYDSVIGFQKEGPIHQFIKGYRLEGRFKADEKEATLCGVFIKTNDDTGLSDEIKMIHYGSKPSFYCE